MAKAAKTAIKKVVDENAKAFTKVIRSVKNGKSGAYTFKDAMVHKDNIAEYLKSK